MPAAGRGSLLKVTRAASNSSIATGTNDSMTNASSGVTRASLMLEFAMASNPARGVPVLGAWVRLVAHAPPARIRAERRLHRTV
jgi:hypothetical protein